MSTEHSAYPLSWPAGWPRTPTEARITGRFSKKSHNGHWSSNADITLSQAVKRVSDQISALDGGRSHWSRIDPDSIVISSNVALRLDGLPRSGQRAPEDPGVCLYFTMDGNPKSVPCDNYTKVEQNVAAIAATIEALRTIERHGSGLMDRAFLGMTALPPPMTGEEPWYSVLEVNPDAIHIEVSESYHRLRKYHHPDMPSGSADGFDRIQKAWERYREQTGN